MPVFVDVSRCISCRACEVACRRIHKGLKNISVDSLDDAAAVPVLCHHCERAPCVTACYTGALFYQDGAVLLDGRLCTDCGLCAIACPSGVVGSDERVHKCDLCQGKDPPVCVATCPVQALADTDPEFFAGGLRARAARIMARGGRA